MSTRAFSLIETMVVVAIVGVVAAIALPSLLPMREHVVLGGSTDLAATAFARARAEAMAQKRCARIRVAGASALVEVLNRFDCDVDPSSAPAASPGPLWIEAARFRFDSDVSIDVLRAPEGSPGPGGDPGELRFRPNGRVFGQDDDLTNDSALYEVSSPVGFHRLLVQGNGAMCVLKSPPLDTPAGPECP
jgi:prepilin-type N-terminal cleavage/methylation domain-containing protein